MKGVRHLVGVIDDDPSVGKALARLLRTAGLDVAIFTTAEEFLAAPAPTEFACLVVDVRLPGMSGLELQQLLRSRRDTPLLFITAHADEQIRTEALAGGAFRFYLKPFDNRQVLQGVFQALGLETTEGSEQSSE